MHKGLLILALISSTLTMGQSANYFLDQGIEAHRMRDYEKALENYNRSIELDNEYAPAYFNRGTIFMALDRDEEAMVDFDRAIELDELFIRAYYSRASLKVDKKEYTSAIEDLNTVLKLKPRYPNALVLRGNLRIAQDDVEGGCADIERALELGSRNAARFLFNNCDYDSTMMETVRLDWLENENWKLSDFRKDDEMIVLEYLKKDESYENWTEMGASQTILNMAELGVEDYMKVIKEQEERSCDALVLKVLHKDLEADYPTVIFQVECSRQDQSSQVQLWQIIQGDLSLYTNFWITKSEDPDQEDLDRWTYFLKSAKVINYLNNKK